MRYPLSLLLSLFLLLGTSYAQVKAKIFISKIECSDASTCAWYKMLIRLPGLVDAMNPI